MTRQTKMIRIQNLGFSYARSDFTLDIDKFEVTKGEKLALIGPSGSGKSTLLNLLAGIQLPVTGSVHIDGKEVSGLNESERRSFRITTIGFIFQDFALLDYLNVKDNILHPYRISSALTMSAKVKERAKTLAQQMDIGDKLRRHPADLSHGEKQRVAICRALLPEPSLILADEATGNLDPVNKQRILDLIFNNVSERKTTLLAVTHDHELLPRFDRVIDFRNFCNGQNHAR